jgi:Zn-finger nucleic acid-binding protein
MSTQDRRVVACPSCGAALPPEAAGRAARCPFCGVTTEPAAPAVTVVKEVIREVVYVQGTPPAAPQPSPPQATATSRACPRCRVPLFETSVHGVALDGCGTCGGIWLDNDGTRAVMQRADPELLGMAERAEKHAKATPDRGPAVPCPQCAQPMKRIAVSGTTLMLDICVAHGTWFDAHELQVFSRAYTLPAAGTFWRTDPAQADGARETLDEAVQQTLLGFLGGMVDRSFER